VNVETATKGHVTHILGDVTFSGGLHIDGTIKGNVTSEGGEKAALTVSESGTIEGDVRVTNLMLNGRVIGDVFASNRVELAPKARVTGTVCYDLLEMSMGAEVNGQLVHSQDAEPRRLGYDEPAVDQDELSGDELSASS
ncbi:bactofilin family protein, partial [endosymbiont of Ridgeia piscesae]